VEALAAEKSTEPTRKQLTKVRALVIEPNQQILKAIEAESGKSKQVPEEDPLTKLTDAGRVIEPPFNLFVLATLPERNTELGPCIEAMETNIDGFGHRLISRVKIDDKDKDGALEKKVVAERTDLNNFFLYAGMDDSFRQLRRNTRCDLESTGNGYWEVIRDAKGDIQYFSHINSYQVRLTAQDANPIEVDMPFLKINEDGSYEIERHKVWKSFRRYVQSRVITRSGYTTRGYQTRWFKQLGDPRTYDCETGDLVEEKQLASWKDTKEPMPNERKANEVVHFKIYSPRSPYGLPRFIGALLDMEGDRKASEINYVTFTNNNVPSIMITVSNGMLTAATIERLKEFFEGLQGDDNRAKAIVVEAEQIGEEEGESPEGQVKIGVEKLHSEQQTDAMFTKYSEANQLKVRVAFRLPPLFVGRSSEYSRAVAETSRRIADEQIFAPEREEFDSWVNRILFPEMGIIYHQFKSNSPNTTDNTELVRILSGSEKTGGMTPRIARGVLEDILGIELGDIPADKLDPDIPFSLTMAEAVKALGVSAAADMSEPGQTVTALKNVAGLLGDGAGGEDVIEALTVLRKQLEEAWTQEVEGDEEEHDHGDQS